jgi:crotonobetainyl-CoA:carnitine CoA-transferase CaiB-like acyl-CoA transferase
LEDPQLLANDGIVELGEDGAGPKQRSVNGPVSFSDARVRPSTRAPQLGEHTDAVLAELTGLSEGERRDPAPQP